MDDKCEHVDPMAYPLLFPYGDGGWQPGLKHKGRQTGAYTRLTSIQFYSYRLMLRDYYSEPDEPEEFWPHTAVSLPHSAGLLFQQWVCDAFSRAEAQRLAWIQHHQKELRAETYDGLYDALHDSAFMPGKSKVGKHISAKFNNFMPGSLMKPCN